MAVSPNLGITLIDSSQNQKEVTANDATVQLDNALNAGFAVLFVSNAYTLGATDYTNNVCFTAGTLTGAGTLTVPLTRRLFIVDNRASGYTLMVAGSSGDAAAVNNGDVALLLCDGTNVFAIAGATGGSAVSLSNVNLWLASQVVKPFGLADGATIAIDFSESNNFSVTLGGDRTLANPSNVVAGQAGQIVVIQDGGGSRTLTLAGNWFPVGGVAPTFSTSPSAIDIISYYAVSTTHISYTAILNA